MNTQLPRSTQKKVDLATKNAYNANKSLEKRLLSTTLEKSTLTSGENLRKNKKGEKGCVKVLLHSMRKKKLGKVGGFTKGVSTMGVPCPLKTVERPTSSGKERVTCFAKGLKGGRR